MGKIFEKIDSLAADAYDDGVLNDSDSFVLECSTLLYSQLLDEISSLVKEENIDWTRGRLIFLTNIGIPIEIKPSPFIFSIKLKKEGE